MNAQVEEITLEKIRLAWAKRVSESQFLLSPIAHVDLVAQDYLEFSVRGYLLGQQSDSINIEYPKTWWDAVKERWLPKWLLKKFPPTYTMHTIIASRMFPDLKYEIPEFQNTLYIIRNSVYDGKIQGDDYDRTRIS